ncbi:MAG: hypothetical protein H6605_01075 [Flavobacteriales bacterium]|nr:hypothetical protein [Flavobacteriales bacterium]
MEILKKIWSYITFRKDPGSEGNKNLKMMHGINKISILIFLIGIVVLLFKCSR